MKMTLIVSLALLFSIPILNSASCNSGFDRINFVTFQTQLLSTVRISRAQISRSSVKNFNSGFTGINMQNRLS
ncbi:hypothetical protein VNO78_10302 [Psophocarpus tetragonolobus]|uniref:Uncharacterized protein n=1 Tax=Psophocarpus tetragonolobus TaxID=3891 RepID=A0AAN9SM39_PSOTE